MKKFEEHIKKVFQEKQEDVDIAKLMQAIPLQQKKKPLFPILMWSSLLVLSMGVASYFIFSEQEEMPLQSGKQISGDTSFDNISLSNIDIAQHNLGTTQTEEIEAPVFNNILTARSNDEIVEKRRRKNGTSSNTLSSNNTVVNNTIVNETALGIEKFTKASSKLGQNEYFENTDNVLLSREQLHEALIQKLWGNYINVSDENILTDLSLPDIVHCPKFGSNPWYFEAGVETGLSKPNKTLSLKNNATSDIFESRVQNENSLEGIDIGLYGAVTRASWPLWFKVGVNYSRWSERLRIQGNYTELDTIQGIISATVSQNGDTLTYIYGDIYVEREYEVNKSIHYYINRIDIPLSVVFEKELGKHSVLGEFGTRFNLSTFTRGLILLNDQNEFQEVNQDGIFRRLTDMSYFLRGHYRYYLNSKKFIGAQGYYQFIPSDFSAPQNDISQKYSNFGFGVYAGYRF